MGITMPMRLVRHLIYAGQWLMAVALAGCCLGSESSEVLAIHVTEPAPGVYRLRAGEPEAIVPSLVRMPARQEELGAMPKVAGQPIPIRQCILCAWLAAVA